ncbi:hypothetical protein [Melioribacter sp. OK-6-Me]|uniref:helix-turn-helix domain-containing protein n=1 Tax=unclassified Melioribacter TaxID=2627329 RepID=UPI003ED99DC3
MSTEKINKLPNAENKNIGERLRIFAIEKWGKKGAIKELAASLNMKPQSLYNYLRNESKPGADILLKLNELGCDLSWLLTGRYAETTQEMVKIIARHSNDDHPIMKRIKELIKENQRLKEENLKLREEIEKLEKLLDAFLDYKKSKTT